MTISKDKFRIGDEIYNLSPSPNGVLDTNEYVSNDNLNPEEWNEVEKIDIKDNNKTIFQKITGMLRNVRFLFIKIGNTDISDIGETITDAIQNLYDLLKTKAYVDHDHRQDYRESLPAVDHIPENIEEKESTIPYSNVIYKMNRDINEKSDEIFKDKKMPSFTTNINFGGIPKGTFIDTNYDTPKEVLEDLLDEGYSNELIAEWTSNEDVEQFFAKHNAENNWNGLLLGHIIRIKDLELIDYGYFAPPQNTDWIIAGFDCENRDFTAKGETYNNGRGIVLVRDIRPPYGNIWLSSWSGPWQDTLLEYGYKRSRPHAKYFPNAEPSFMSLLKTHLVKRKVLVSNSARVINNTWVEESLDYEWDDACFTLLSPVQMWRENTNEEGELRWNDYDIGEANYKLPIYNPSTYNKNNRYTPDSRFGYLLTRSFIYSTEAGKSGSIAMPYGASSITGMDASNGSSVPAVMMYVR